MFRTSRKILSVIVTVVMLFSMCAFAGVAAVEKENSYPVIYFTGYGQQIFTEKGNHNSEMLYPTGVDVASSVKEALAPCLMELAIGSATGDYSAYCDALYDSIAPIYDDLRLNPDGTVKDNSGSWKNSYSMSYGKYGMIHYSYDWRLSPITLAADLKDAIDIVLDKYNAEKVNLVGRCFGANVVAAYLELYGTHAEENVNNIVYYVPSITGIGLVGAIFSGDIKLDSNNTDIYVNEMMDYLNIMDDGLVKDFLLVMVSIFDQAEILGFGVDKLQGLIDDIKDNLIPRLVRDSYGSFLSFWSMVPDEYLDDAIEFVYNTDELKAEYEGSISLIREYNELVQDDAKAKIAAQGEKFDVSVISKYNLPSAPVFGKDNPTGDGVAETYYTSVGATTAKFGSGFKADYIDAMDEDAKKYLSADEKIDASACALPDTTWFIKNSYHDNFPESIDELINTFLTTEGMTVFSDEAYPQYLDASVDGETLTPVTEKDEDLPKPGSDADKFAMLFNFIKVAIQLLIELFKKIAAMV